MSTRLEEQVASAHQSEALEAVREEYGKYFEAIEKHPRFLVGETVPSITGEGTETLRDSADAKEWQEAVKGVLVNEVRDRASRAMEENSEFLDTIHSSIELFQKNPELIPGTRGFDMDLADRLTTMLEPYELRHEGKLQGYSIPVQPLVDSIRRELATARAAAPTPTPAAQPQRQQARDESSGRYKPEDAPQAGISSKAGAASSDSDDWQSALFGTLGNPDFRV